MNLALNGGTFDPVHHGHIRPLQEIASSAGWDRIDMIPARAQPFKADRSTVSAFDRYAMLVLATAEDPLFRVSKIELEREGISYTVDTLESYRSDLGGAPTIDWIIGDDNLARLDEWRDPERILQLANFIVLTRGGNQSDLPTPLRSRVTEMAERGSCGSIIFAGNEIIDVSSTRIREKLSEGKSITGLVPKCVEDYIERYELYRD